MPIISSISAGARSLGIYVMTLLVSVTDTFNRSNNTTDLGSISGQKWKIWRAAWQILTNKAYSATDPTSYPMATLTFTKTDVTVSVSGQDPGMGASFWVTDANNWYASVYTQTQVCQTCSSCTGTYNASTCPTWNSSTCPTWNAQTCPTWNAQTCPTWNASTCPSFNAGTCANPQPCINSPGNCGLTGYVCCQYNPCTAYNACNSWSCNVYNSVNTGRKAPPYGFCWTPNTFCTSVRNCAPGGSTCAANCCNGNFPTWSPYCSGTYNACSGFNVRNCTTAYNASNCASGYNVNTCASGYNVNNCGSGWNTSNCASGWNSVFCNQLTPFSCNCTIEHRVNIIKSIAGIISTISNNLFSAAVASFKTALSGNNATITAYSSVNYVTQIGNSVVTSISPAPVKTNMHGIIKSSSPYAQGTSIDDFGVN